MLTIFYRFSCLTETVNRLVAAISYIEWTYCMQVILYRMDLLYAGYFIQNGPIVCRLCYIEWTYCMQVILYRMDLLYAGYLI